MRVRLGACKIIKVPLRNFILVIVSRQYFCCGSICFNNVLGVEFLCCLNLLCTDCRLSPLAGYLTYLVLYTSLQEYAHIYMKKPQAALFICKVLHDSKRVLLKAVERL